MDVLWRVFRIVAEPVPYSFLSVNRRNNEAPARSTDTNVHGTDSVKIRKTLQKIRVYTDIFTVYG